MAVVHRDPRAITMDSRRRLDLVLVNPGGRRQVYQSLATRLAAVEPPVWAGLIATFIRKRGFSVAIIDADAENLSAEETAARVHDTDPVLAAIVVYGHQPSASTQNMPGAGAIARAVKATAPDVKVVMVGGHVAAEPVRTLMEEDTDFVCGGEGPYTVLELLQALNATGDRQYGNVRGLYYREDGRIKTSEPPPLVTNLEAEMPGLAWDLLPMEKYRAHNWHGFGQPSREPYAALYTTLGCPYHCTFCCIQAPYKSGERQLGYRDNVNSYRLWEPAAVIEQIDTLVTRYGVKNIKIADEMFVLNARHVLRLCDLIIERGYDLNIWAYARVDTVRDRMLETLRRAGFTWLAFGIEAANERVRNDVAKGFSQDLVLTTVKNVRAEGINVIGNFIFGLPEDDAETMQATLDLALDLNCEFVNFYCAMAYPGAPLYRRALAERWPLPERWSGYSQHSVDTLPLPTKYLSAADVLRFRDRAFHVYFDDPRYLAMISDKFGPDTREQIRDMATIRLERRFA
jgi:anaerobic magnesium-protoporphyrin IX monomethyl ester cyclase